MKWVASVKKSQTSNIVPFLPSKNEAIAAANFSGAVLSKQFLADLPSGVFSIVRDAGGQNFVFNGKLWKPTSDDTIKKLILNHSVITDFQHKDAVKAVNKIKNEIDIVCHDENFGKHSSDSDFSITNCENGELWIDKQGMAALKPHQQTSWQFDCLPFAYDETASCPMFFDALKGIFANSSDPAEMIRHLFEIIGYCLQDRRNIPLWIFFIGKGRNGKSKLLQTIGRLVGADTSLNMSLNQFQKSGFNVIALRGKKLFIDDDMKTNTMLDDGLLKWISEGKPITTRAAYGKQHVTFTSLVVPLLASNHYPQSADTSEGFKRRLNVIPFDRVFSEQEDDKQLFPLIWKTEMPGILNEAVKGYLRLCKRKALKPPADCIKAAKTFMIYSNPLAEFVAEGCVAAATETIELPKFREAMNIWAKEQGVKISAPSYRLRSSLRDLGYETYMSCGYPKVKGLALKSASNPVVEAETQQ